VTFRVFVCIIIARSYIRFSFKWKRRNEALHTLVLHDRTKSGFNRLVKGRVSIEHIEGLILTE
jgi:hypothetical protein